MQKKLKQKIRKRIAAVVAVVCIMGIIGAAWAVSSQKARESAASGAGTSVYAGGNVSGYAAAQTGLYSGPAQNYHLLVQIPVGANVEYKNEFVRNSDGGLWYRIDYNGFSGWASSEFIVLDGL